MSDCFHGRDKKVPGELKVFEKSSTTKYDYVFIIYQNLAICQIPGCIL